MFVRFTRDYQAGSGRMFLGGEVVDVDARWGNQLIAAGAATLNATASNPVTLVTDPLTGGKSIQDGSGNVLFCAGLAPVGDPPAGLGWDSARYPVTAYISASGQDRPVGAVPSMDPVLATHFATALAATPIYVDKSTGNDTTGNGSIGNKYATYTKAQQVANAGGVPAHIIMIGGPTREYQLAEGFNGSAIQPTVPTIITASNGIVRSSTRYSATFGGSKDATYTNTYVAAIATTMIARLVMLRKLKEGSDEGEDAIRVADAATCNATPGSYSVVGTNLYYNPWDGIAPTSANTSVFQAGTGNARMAGASPVSVWLRTETDRDGWLLEGGSTGAFRAVYSALPAQQIILAMDNVRMRYAGTRHASNVNQGVQSRQVEVDGLHGLLIARNCHVGSSGDDGWNIHRTLGGASTYVLLVNCTGERSGIPDPSASAPIQSCNVVTPHEDVTMIVVGGSFERSYGRTFYAVGSSKTWIVGPVFGKSFGDRMAGGSFDPCELGLGNTAEVWIDRVELRPVGGGFPAIAVDDTAKLHVRNALPLGNKISVSAGATVDSY